MQAVNSQSDFSVPLSPGLLPLADAEVSRIEALPKPPRGDRKTARSLLAKGLELLAQPDQTVAAVNLLSQAHEADPRDVQIVNDLAYAQMKAGLLLEAAKSLQKAHELSPTRTSAWANRAELLLLQGQGSEAAVDEATRSLVVAYWFSGDRARTVEFLRDRASSDSHPPAFAAAARKALARLGMPSE